MNTHLRNVKTTAYRDFDHISISTYSIEVRDAYGADDRQVVEIIASDDEIMEALIKFISIDHRWLQKNTEDNGTGALERLQRLAGAMGLEYVATTGED